MKKSFTFDGRINRAKYIGIYLLLNLACYSLREILEPINNSWIDTMFMILAFLSIIFNICLKVQRLHDLNRSGYHYFLTWIPIYNIYIYIILIFEKGTDGPNEYGEDPLSNAFIS